MAARRVAQRRPRGTAAEDRGTIFKAGWTINYIFRRDNQKYIEFYATHRMTNARRHRIYESGRVDDVDAIQEMYMYDPGVPGSEQEARKRYMERNQRVAEELRQLGLYLSATSTPTCAQATSPPAPGC